MSRSTDGEWWRALEDGADPAAQELGRLDPIRRREFLKLMGAALALGGFAGCSERPPAEPIVPYVRAPEGVIAGQAVYYATAMPSAGGVGLGLLVKSHLGRPLKVEGNPDHPASLGATDAFAC